MSHNSPAIVYTDHPKNTEPTLDALVARENFYTPLDLAFQRNHAEFPDETAFAAFWKLSVLVEEGVVAKRWEISRDRLGEARKGPGTEEGSVERVLWEGGWDDMRTAVGQGGGDRRLRAALQVRFSLQMGSPTCLFTSLSPSVCRQQAQRALEGKADRR